MFGDGIRSPHSGETSSAEDKKLIDKIYVFKSNLQFNMSYTTKRFRSRCLEPKWEDGTRRTLEIQIEIHFYYNRNELNGIREVAHKN